MRRLSGWARLSSSRTRHRVRYAAYLESPTWHGVREEWLDEHRKRFDSEPVCRVCGLRWTLRDDLHHRTYDNLGQERYDDLVPMCRGCHERLHSALDRSPTWRRVEPGRATDLLIARLREELACRLMIDSSQQSKPTWNS
jgi:hypothetical protein